jgi:hypothetical protein
MSWSDFDQSKECPRMHGVGEQSDRSSTGLSTDRVDASNIARDRDDLIESKPKAVDKNALSRCMVARTNLAMRPRI